MTSASTSAAASWASSASTWGCAPTSAISATCRTRTGTAASTSASATPTTGAPWAVSPSGSEGALRRDDDDETTPAASAQQGPLDRAGTEPVPDGAGRGGPDHGSQSGRARGGA